LSGTLAKTSDGKSGPSRCRKIPRVSEKLALRWDNSLSVLKNSASKRVIDHADAILADDYAFSLEEQGYIINCNVKFRVASWARAMGATPPRKRVNRSLLWAELEVDLSSSSVGERSALEARRIRQSGRRFFHFFFTYMSFCGIILITVAFARAEPFSFLFFSPTKRAPFSFFQLPIQTLSTRHEAPFRRL
jgi:hypothetical protein